MVQERLIQISYLRQAVEPVQRTLEEWPYGVYLHRRQVIELDRDGRHQELQARMDFVAAHTAHLLQDVPHLGNAALRSTSACSALVQTSLASRCGRSRHRIRFVAVPCNTRLPRSCP